MAEKITSRFTAASTALDVVQGVSLRDKVAIVTGGNAGIGLEVARALCSAGAETILAVRNTERGEAAAQSIRDRIPHARVSASELDLSDLDSVRAFADRHSKRTINILINNAGVMGWPEPRTKQGFEITIGINHLGHFLLTLMLVPALRRGAPARVVVVSSGGHWMGPFNFEDWNYNRRTPDRILTYFESKTANVLFTIEFDRRYRGDGIAGFVVAPGLVATQMGRFLTDEDNRKLGMTPEVRAMSRTPEQGAAVLVWAAIAPELEGHGGLYLENCAEVPVGHPDKPLRGVAPFAVDLESARRLWDISCEAVEFAP